MNSHIIVILCILALIGFGILYQLIEKKLSAINYKDAYQARELLTGHEQSEYQKLRQFTEQENWLICPKVRIADLLEAKKSYNKKQRQMLFNKISQKHVDFVICDRDMHILGVVEVDDSTHDRKNRILRDQFVREALEGAGIAMIQTRNITEDTLDPIRSQRSL